MNSTTTKNLAKESMKREIIKEILQKFELMTLTEIKMTSEKGKHFLQEDK
jgi:hypothetical protein